MENESSSHMNKHLHQWHPDLQCKGVTADRQPWEYSYPAHSVHVVSFTVQWGSWFWIDMRSVTSLESSVILDYPRVNIIGSLLCFAYWRRFHCTSVGYFPMTNVKSVWWMWIMSHSERIWQFHPWGQCCVRQPTHYYPAWEDKFSNIRQSVHQSLLSSFSWKEGIAHHTSEPWTQCSELKGVFQGTMKSCINVAAGRWLNDIPE
jgi:hypothetical protein